MALPIDNGDRGDPGRNFPSGCSIHLMRNAELNSSSFRIGRRTGLARYGRSQTNACRLLDRAPSRWHLARSGFATVVEYERIPRGRLLRAGLNFFNVTSLGLRPRRGGQPYVGARVTAVVDGYRLVCILARRISYVSTSDSRLFIALGAANRADRLEIRWLSGASQPWS